MIKDGHIEIDIYKRRIKVTVHAHYINALGRDDWMLHYYWIKYHNRFWRWYLKDEVIRQVKALGEEIGLPVAYIRNFSIIDGSDTITSIKEETILDFHKNKRGMKQ